MELSEQERAFLGKRQRLLRYWPAVTVVLALGWLALVGWLWLAHPLLANPTLVQKRLQADQLTDGTMQLLAVMLPVVIDLCLLLLLVVIVFVAVALRNEHRYQEIVRKLERGGNDRGVREEREYRNE